MCSFVVPDAKQFGIKKIQVDEQIGIIAIWYPILKEECHAPVISELKSAGFPKAICHEGRFVAGARRASGGRIRNVRAE